VINLSPLTRRHVEALFPPEDVAPAERLLAEECAEALPAIAKPATPDSLERIRFAALRVSGGSLPRLREAIALARLDWRDLLMEADFADDPDAHRSWRPGT
jgi:hypothetical protein